MRFDVVTIFPEILDSYFNFGILKRAKESQKIEIYFHNLRNWTFDKRKTVDDIPYGGGNGMILKVEPIFRAINDIKVKDKKKKVRVLLTSAKGKIFNQKRAQKYAFFDQIILIAGRYEGVDERIAQYIADEELSIGKYILSGGELAAMVVIDAVARLVPGVLGNIASLKEESYSKDFKKEYPQYTRPEVFNNWKVPEVLLSGNHKKIKLWQKMGRK